MKVHLVDGTFELFRAYYGAPKATFGGREVGASRAFLRSLFGLLAQKDCSHVAVAFDTVIESFRNELFDGYKTGAGIEEPLKSQFPLVEQAAAAAGVVSWGMLEFEADDAIAAAAVRYKLDPRVQQVVVCTPDKDLGQVVDGDRVVMLDRIRRKTINEDGVREKFGVSPKAIPDYLAFVGDTADGIPGVPKWGQKSTAIVLDRYGALEDVPDDETTWDIKVRGAKSLGESLRAHRDVLPLYKTLATLRLDVPLKESVDDLRWTGPDAERLAALRELLGGDDAVYQAPPVKPPEA